MITKKSLCRLGSNWRRLKLHSKRPRVNSMRHVKSWSSHKPRFEIRTCNYEILNGDYLCSAKIGKFSGKKPSQGRQLRATYLARTISINDHHSASSARAASRLSHSLIQVIKPRSAWSFLCCWRRCKRVYSGQVRHHHHPLIFKFTFNSIVAEYIVGWGAISI